MVVLSLVIIFFSFHKTVWGWHTVVGLVFPKAFRLGYKDYLKFVNLAIWKALRHDLKSCLVCNYLSYLT